MSWRVGILMLLLLPLSLTEVVVMLGKVGAVAGGGGGATSSGGSGTQFAAATANDLANRAFPFPSGLSQTFATRFGLPPGQAFTLQFGTFTGATAPLTLSQGARRPRGPSPWGRAPCASTRVASAPVRAPGRHPGGGGSL